eukprot:5707241-Pyramimonas_sp.AAC.1
MADKMSSEARVEAVDLRVRRRRRSALSAPTSPPHVRGAWRVLVMVVVVVVLVEASPPHVRGAWRVLVMVVVVWVLVEASLPEPAPPDAQEWKLLGFLNIAVVGSQSQGGRAYS